MQKIYSHEAEEAFLGCLLIDPSLFMHHPLQVSDFYIVKHQYVYQAMADCFREYGTIDNILITERLDQAGTLGEVGGDAFLVRLITSTATVIHAGSYAAEIRKKAQSRDFVEIAREIVRQATTDELNPAMIVDRINKAIQVDSEFSDLNEVADNFSLYVQERQENPSDIWGIPTPWGDFNKVTGGLHPHEAVMFYGDSNIGKTILVLQIGFYAAAQGYNVDFYELEMTDMNLFGRLVSMQTEIPTRSIHKGLLEDYQRIQIRDAIDYVKSLPIRISQSSHWTSQEILADQLKRGSNRADIVIVDYLALLNDKAETEHQKVEIAAKILRQMAKDLGQVVITVASDIKDGSIKGTKEVKFSQDEIWHIVKETDNLQDRVRKLIPAKRRNDGTMSYVELVLIKDVPKFGDVFTGKFNG